MRAGILIAFLLGLGIGVLAMDIACELRVWRATQPAPIKSAVMTCAHWNAVGQPWRCV